MKAIVAFVGNHPFKQNTYLFSDNESKEYALDLSADISGANPFFFDRMANYTQIKVTYSIIGDSRVINHIISAR